MSEKSRDVEIGSRSQNVNSNGRGQVGSRSNEKGLLLVMSLPGSVVTFVQAPLLAAGLAD